MNYRAEIDGLRALAVLPVILFHAGFEWFSGGFVGVDVFFVISGYLITTIIISEMAEGEFSIVNFYERRARRILPALFFVMLACLPFAWFWLTKNDLKDFGGSLVAVSIFSSNILFWLESGYFDTAAELKPLLHTWSLAVEEQYYILFPVFLMLTWRLGLKWVLTLLTIVFVISLGIAHWATTITMQPKFISGSFFLLLTRVWELLIGVFVAFYLKNNSYLKSHIANQILSLIGLGMIVYSIIAFDENTPFPSLYALLPTVGTGLLILSAVPNTAVNKFLSLSPIVGIGLFSYSAYLWHQPIFAFSRHKLLGDPSDLLLIILCVLSLVMAYISWRWVEQPFRNKKKITRKKIFTFSILGIIFFSLLGLIIHKTNGFDKILNDDQRAIMDFKDYNVKDLYRQGSCFLRSDQGSTEFSEDCKKGSLLIWGDSHAAALSAGFREIGNVSQLTSTGCPPLINIHIIERPNCLEKNNSVMDYLKNSGVKKIILHSDWLRYQTEDLNALKDTIKELFLINDDFEVFVFASVPKWKPSLPAILVRHNKSLKVDGDLYLINNQIDKIEARDDFIKTILTELKNDNLTFISVLDRLCFDGVCLAIKNDGLDEPMAWDSGHLTESGSKALTFLLKDNIGIY